MRKNSDKGSASTSKKYKLLCKKWNIEIEYSQPRLYTGTGTVERAIQTLKNLTIANLGDKIRLTESINRALRIMRFKIHTGFKVSPFKVQHGRKPRTEQRKIIKRNKSYFSDWTTLNVSVPPKQIRIHLERLQKSEVTDQMVRARKRKTPCCTS